MNKSSESYRSNQVHSAPTHVRVPGRIEAEDCTAMSGVKSEVCGDTGGSLNLGHFDPNDFIEFNIRVKTAGEFTLRYRLASETGSEGFEVSVDDQVVDTQAVDATGGWQMYQTQTSEVFSTDAGNHTIRFRSVGEQWNINWFEVVP